MQDFVSELTKRNPRRLRKKSNLLRMKFQSLEMLRKELKQHLILRRKSPKMLRKLKKRRRMKM